MKTPIALWILAIFLIVPIGSFAQQGKTTAPAGSGQAMEPSQGADNPKMMERRQEMKAEHEKMMKEMDARLDAKVAAMDAAKGEKRIDAMEDVINEMIAQRKEMREHMMKMKEQWNHHMKKRKTGGGECRTDRLAGVSSLFKNLAT